MHPGRRRHQELPDRAARARTAAMGSADTSALRAVREAGTRKAAAHHQAVHGGSGDSLG